MLSKAQVAIDLQAAQEIAKAEAILTQETRTAHLQQMAYWLTLDDPILMAEALAWLRQQPPEHCAELLDIELAEEQVRSLSTIITIVEQLQRLDWGPQQLSQALQTQFSTSSLAHLTPEQRQRWLSYLESLPDTG